MLAQPDVYPDLTTTHSQLFAGRAVAALANDPNVLAKTGTTLKAIELADEYGFTDTDSTASATR